MSDSNKKIQTYTCPSGLSEMHDTVWWNAEYIPDLLPEGNPWEPRRCSCGCWKTYGEDCPIEFHSQWCDLVRSN